MASGATYGQFMIKYADQAESSPQNVYSESVAVISGGAKAEPTGANATAIPYTMGGIKQNAACRGRILVYFKANATVTIESEECQWSIPGLLIDEKTGKQADSLTLTQENMTGFTQAGTVDVVATIGLPARLAYYDVPRGLAFMLNPNGKVRAYFGDNA
jgi:hypothetical protein